MNLLFPLSPPKYTGPERRARPRRQIRPLRVLLLLLWLAIAGYAAAVLWLMSQETRLVFGAVAALGDGRPPGPWQQVDLPRPDGAPQFAWVMPQAGADTAPWVLYFHGSPSTVASPVNLAHYRLLRNLGLNVLAPEYRGFGGLEGVPTGDALASDARAAYDYLRVTQRVEPARLVIYGWSLGSALAIDLASELPAAAVIVEGAPSSLADLGQQRYPFFPVRLLMRDPFDSVRKIASVPSPVLVMHSRSDDVIPFEEGRKLFDAAAGEKSFAEVRGGHLTAADVDGEQVSGSVRAFLEQHGVLAGPAGAAPDRRDR
jgi:fermentation-respiration switch protein FrsA (DUF1100 family)